MVLVVPKSLERTKFLQKSRIKSSLYFEKKCFHLDRRTVENSENVLPVKVASAKQQLNRGVMLGLYSIIWFHFAERIVQSETIRRESFQKRIIPGENHSKKSLKEITQRDHSKRMNRGSAGSQWSGEHWPLLITWVREVADRDKRVELHFSDSYGLSAGLRYELRYKLRYGLRYELSYGLSAKLALMMHLNASIVAE